MIGNWLDWIEATQIAGMKYVEYQGKRLASGAGDMRAGNGYREGACEYCGRAEQTTSHRTCDGCGATKRPETWKEMERRMSINIPGTMTPNPFYGWRR